MTDSRHVNDACYTQLAQQQRLSNTQGVLSTSFRSCTPEKFQGSMLKEQHQLRIQKQSNPLLQSLIDYTHGLIAPPNSVTAIGQNYSDTNGSTGVGVIRSTGVETGILSMDGVHFDEHDIYYVSPTKRKSSFRSTLLKQQQQGARFKTKSPLRSTTTINCSQTRIPSNAHGSRLAGIAHDFSLDETSSHFSDSAMQVLRSGSISGNLFGETQRHVSLTNNNSCHSHSSSNSSLVAPSGRFQRSNSIQNNTNINNNNINNNTVTFKQTTHRGSLQRIKGRSTQSLCSCEAGNDAEIDMQSTRPLYQYDVDGKMTHTYTCEQNAQILMRLARERQRKLSLTADIGLKDNYGSTNALTKGRSKTEKQVCTSQKKKLKTIFIYSYFKNKIRTHTDIYYLCIVRISHNT